MKKNLKHKEYFSKNKKGYERRIHKNVFLNCYFSFNIKCLVLIFKKKRILKYSKRFRIQYRGSTNVSEQSIEQIVQYSSRVEYQPRYSRVVLKSRAVLSLFKVETRSLLGAPKPKSGAPKIFLLSGTRRWDPKQVGTTFEDQNCFFPFSFFLLFSPFLFFPLSFFLPFFARLGDPFIFCSFGVPQTR